MSVWLQKRFPIGTSYADAQDRLEKILMTSGKYQELMMVSERDGDGLDEIVFIWLDNEHLAVLFPEFQECTKPASQRPAILVAANSLYDKFFPKGR